METTDEFMARFRATGLDMLTEMRRREVQEQGDRRWAWGPGVTKTMFGGPYGLHNIPKGSLEEAFVLGRRWGHRHGPVVYSTDWSNGDLRVVRHLGDGVEIDVHKSAAVGWASLDNLCLKLFDAAGLDFNTFPAIDIDFSQIENRVISADFPGGSVEHVKDLRSGLCDPVVIGGNRIGRSSMLSQAYQRQAAAVLLAASAFNDMGSLALEWKPAPTPQPIQYKTWSKNDPVRFGNNKAWKVDRSTKKKLAKASRKRNRK